MNENIFAKKSSLKVAVDTEVGGGYINLVPRGFCFFNVRIALKSIFLYRKSKTFENEPYRFILEKHVVKILVKTLKNTDQGVHVFVKL